MTLLGRAAVVDHELIATLLGSIVRPTGEGERLERAGLYVWLTDDKLRGRPLYIGSSADVDGRLAKERRWIASFRDRRVSGLSRWHAAGCGLEPVLDAHLDRHVAVWRMPLTEARALEVALIRLCALYGETPPAQGVGWDWGREGESVAKGAASALLSDWESAGRLPA